MDRRPIGLPYEVVAVCRAVVVGWTIVARRSARWRSQNGPRVVAVCSAVALDRSSVARRTVRWRSQNGPRAELSTGRAQIDRHAIVAVRRGLNRRTAIGWLPGASPNQRRPPWASARLPTFGSIVGPLRPQIRYQLDTAHSVRLAGFGRDQNSALAPRLNELARSF